MGGTQSRENRLIVKFGGGFAYVAFWQSAIFLMLILLVWVNELIDLTALIFQVPKTPMDAMRGCVATAGVLVAAIVTIGNTYLQQKRIVAGLLTICSYCKRVRVDTDNWQRVEEYMGRHSDLDFTHSVCPACYKDVTDMLDIEAPEPPSASTPPG